MQSWGSEFARRLRKRRDVMEGPSTRHRYVVALLLFTGALSVSQITNAQDSTSTKSTQESAEGSLKLLVTGSIVLSTGRHGLYRLFEAPDGVKVAISYADFASADDAKRQIQDWLKLAQVVTSHEQRKSKQGLVIGERIVGTRKSRSGEQQEFLIIRRDDSNCYFIESISLRVATQAEESIE